LHTAHELHSVSKNAPVSGATAPEPPTNLCALIATNTNAARGEAESDEGKWERNANVQELSEASDQAI
jgi:hypothetical protein